MSTSKSVFKDLSERVLAPNRWRPFWRSKLTIPNPRLTKVSEAATESESTYGGNDFASTMDADRAFQLEVESDAIMPVVLPPVQPNYTLYNTEPETPPIPDITAIYSKIERVSHRFGNGWAPTLDRSVNLSYSVIIYLLILITYTQCINRSFLFFFWPREV
ncbi:hypothetical protein DFP73DRAFT_541185 [Morchella snyderi]|nr:hypothetical protein DFP73DRAFT_541185 [Morchella snyderi]